MPAVERNLKLRNPISNQAFVLISTGSNLIIVRSRHTSTVSQFFLFSKVMKMLNISYEKEATPRSEASGLRPRNLEKEFT